MASESGSGPAVTASGPGSGPAVMASGSGSAAKIAGRRPLCVLRGGGDLATGVAWRLTRAGWPVVVLELPEPLTIRRTVALSTAVTSGEVSVEAMRGVRTDTTEEATETLGRGDVAVMVAPSLAGLEPLRPDVVVDARLAKRNIDTSIGDADLVIGLGPGFTAGSDCHAVIETMRGHRLGRVIWSGSAQPDTRQPAELGGRSNDRVLRAPFAGTVTWQAAIGDLVAEGQRIGQVGGATVRAPFDGVLRGAIADGTRVHVGLKIGDIDPRSEPSACWEISDKALAVGGAVLEAVLTRLAQQ